MKKINNLCLFLILCVSVFGDITVRFVSLDLEKDFQNDSVWQGALEESIAMMGQPMINPKPKGTHTPQIRVTAVHDGKWAAFRLRWKDEEVSESKKLGTYSDAVAIQFPVLNPEQPPAIMMGHTGSPVHIFHWRYQYQEDARAGMPDIQEIYPNMTVDMYPADFKVKGNFNPASSKDKDAFLGGRAANNPQSQPKIRGVDELIAEGFGSSTTMNEVQARALGAWKNGEWTVYILRPLSYASASSLTVGGKSHVAFAVWQGGKEEIGGLKSLTMAWTPVTVSGAKDENRP